ncbi:MAG: Holliday junction branch migration protein RuvA [Actinobacteria bacterium]|nr:Holliday junction branch migration protein RuvA [Actinomycetota bacterium]
MISYLEGKIIEKGPDHLVVLTGGIGYEVRVPACTVEKAPPVGDKAVLHTYLQVRQDAIQLYGFDSARSRDLFVKLTSVSGFGSAKALSVLSIFSPEGFEKVVSSGDAEALTVIPGVGKKSAQRLVLEMKDKVESVYDDIPGLDEPERVVFVEALEALVQLGYSRPEARTAIGKYPFNEREACVEEILHFVLRRMDQT